MIGGIVCLILSLSVFLWAKEHSPNMGFGEMLMKMDSYYIKQPVYNILLIFCALLGLIGIINVLLGTQAYIKRD